MELITFASEGFPVEAALYKPPVHPPVHPPSHAVILCHGAFEDRASWADYARRLAEQGFATLALDFVGHGASGGQRGLVSLQRWAYNIRDAMNALAARGYTRFALVGWGSGGSAALLAAAHDPRLECCVVLAAPVQMVPPLAERAAYTLATGASRVWKAIKKRPLTLSRRKEFEGQRFAVDDQADAAYKASPMLQETLQAVPVPESLDSVWVDITRAVVKIRVPVLILHGQRDAVVPLKQSEKLHALLTGMKKLCVIEDAGHALHLDQKKDEVYIEIARWIKRYLNK